MAWKLLNHWELSSMITRANKVNPTTDLSTSNGSVDWVDHSFSVKNAVITKPSVLPRYISESAAILAGIIGLAVLVGWFLDVEALKSVVPGLSTMKPNTAVSFILCSISLLLFNRSPFIPGGKYLYRIAAIPVILLALLTLSQHAFDMNLGIDVALFPEEVQREAIQRPGRMSPITAINLLVVSITLTSLGRRWSGKKSFDQWPALFVTVIALLSVMGYAYDADALHKIYPFSTIALHTAFSFLLISLGIIFARGEHGVVAILFKDSIGGTLARKLLPAAIVIPFVLGWIRLKGQEWGYYGTEFGLTLFATSNILVFTFLIWRSAYSLDIADTRRLEEKSKSDRSSRDFNDIKYALDESALVAITDQTGKITFVNDKFCEISKYSRAELIGQDHRIVNSGHHSKEYIRDIWTTIANGKVWRGELKNKAKNGSIYWVDTTIVPLLNRNGKPKQYIAIRYDITTRKWTEEKIEELLKELIDIKFALDESSIVAITDQTGKITFVNDKFCQISGYEREELIGQDHRIINSVYHSKEFIRGIWITIASGKTWHGEIKNRAKDGSFYWVDTTIVPFLNESRKPYQYVAIRNDITQRKLSEEKSAQLAAIVESSEDSIVSTSLDGILTSWNKGAELMYGYSAEEMIGQTKSVLLSRENLHQLNDELDAARSGKRIENYEAVRIRKDGTKVTVFVATSPIRDYDGKIVGVSFIARDITEKKQAEAKLNESRAQLQTIVENLDEGVAVMDLSGNILHLNRAAMEMHDFTSMEDCLQHFQRFSETFELRDMQDAPLPMDQWPPARILAGEKLRDQEVNMYRRGSQWHRIFNYGGMLVHGKNGETLMAVITIDDITERKKTEVILRESEERYRLLFENNPFPMWVYDLATLQFLAVNDAAILHYGYSRKEFLSMTIRDIRPPEALPALMKNLAENPARMDSADVWQHRKKSGTPINVEVTSHELIFAGRLSRLVLANDITEKLQAEQKARESQKQFRELTESLPQLVWTCRGEDGSCDYLSPQWVEYTGVPEKEQLGFGWLESINPEDREQTIAAWRQSVAQADIFDTEFRIRRHDGVYRWFKTRSVPFKDEDGKILKWIGTNTDIEAGKRAADEIRQLNESLEQRVVERTHELEAANKELESFSYSVSHDLRAPLRAIDGFSLALLDDYGDKLADEGKHYLERVRAGSQRMAQLIDDMLNLSRITRVEIKRDLVDLSKAVTDICERLQENQPERRAVFHIQSGVTAQGDERLMRVAMENLLGNAWKFTSKKDIAEIAFGHDGSEYFVRDNGAGFDMAYADKLFGAFQRLHNSNDFEGTGIGLATVLRVIRRHRGSVRAESKMNEGTCFYFTLSA
jgi:PAS domain S-box-containing protein